jgi:hypothetical protein
MKISIALSRFSLVVVCCVAASAEMVPYSRQWNVKLQSLPPNQVLARLDLDRPGLEAVKAAFVQGDQPRALAELLRYYRGKYPPPLAAQGTRPPTFKAADALCRHVFQWGPYKPADYGTNIDWTINPADDIEWVAAIYRFYWADDLTKAYTATRDDRYARAFVELTTDWIAKHPLDDWTRTHPTLDRWKGFAWLDLQTGIRATKAVAAFKAMLHSEAVTPDFLATFLASLYDHQHKTELVPMGVVANKAIFEQCGVLNICQAVPEFSDTLRWATLALERAQENLLAQTTPEGVQREWCGSYHLAVLRDSLAVMDNAAQLGVPVPDEFRRRVRGMCDYVFAVATPDLGFPMFGDTGRAPKDGKAPLYDPLLHFSAVWNDPKYATRAKVEVSGLPKQTSCAFKSAGLYLMRSQWGPEGSYLALHCPPPAISGHDQPDNGTFELFAFGRWLMTDSGYYTYGHDRQARAWHRQTRVHQTLTLDGKDSKTDGRLRLWHSSPELDVVVVENGSYAGLLHRRSVWFVDKQFYVFLDEAIGKTPGELCLHWTPSPGTGRFSTDRASFTTQFPDANVLIHNAGPHHAKFEEEDGWFAWDYGQRLPRKMLSVKHPEAAPATFLTVLAPYRGTNPPAVEATLVGNPIVGGNEVQISVSAFGKGWSVGRNLEKGAAWCETVENDRAAASVGLERAITLGSASHEDEFAAIGSDDGGNVWVCWVAFDGQADAVLATKVGQTASAPTVLSEASGDHWRPAMCRDGKGRLWATWARSDQGKWSIWGKFLAAGKWSDAIRLTRGKGNDFGQKLAMDQAGALWMTWQSVVNGNYEVLLAAITPDGPGEALNVSRHPANDWEPAITAAKDGRVFVAWDSFRSGSYDILVAELKDGRLSEPVGIATSPAYEAHASLAVDHEDRLWIAWDNGGVRWGEDNEDGRKLHSERSVEIRCLAHGELAEPAEPLSAALTGPLATFCELPELNIDGSGRLWLIVRHLTDLTPKQVRPDGRHSQDRGIWNPYLLCYDGNRWSQPQRLPDSNGRNDMRTSTCLDPDGRAWAAWADDGRTVARPPEPQDHNVHAVPLAVPGPDKVVLKTVARGQARPAPRTHEQSANAAHPKLSVGGREFLLAYGDTHRHTDLSQCGMNRDGSLMDTYRYAIDVARLDFLAISDHDQDLLKHRANHIKGARQHYGWWRSQKYCDLFHIEHKFVPLYAYEHGGALTLRGGHKNVLYVDRGQPCYEEHSPEELFKGLQGKNAIAIPHQLADGPSAVDWKQWNPEFERVAEVFQARGSYEFKGAAPQVRVSRDGYYYRDALTMGIRIGAIASSDHGMVHSAYAGVYCRELSRAAVMEGLRSRRTFGSMDRMVIEFRLGDRLLGEEVEINTAPAFNVRIESPKALRKVQIVRDGSEVHTLNPDTPACGFDYVDQDLQPGQQAWYYVRCEQNDDRYGWSSPIWVTRKASASK